MLSEIRRQKSEGRKAGQSASAKATAGRYDKGMAKKRKTSAKAAKRGARTRTTGPRATRKKTVARSGRKTAGAKRTTQRTAAPKYVYFFGDGTADGDRSMKDLLGGKGAGLAEMTNAGLPVPPGFTITTEACGAYYAAGEEFPPQLWEQALDALAEVERQTGKRLGDPHNPLLVAVRSGAKFSMPGMMDTVLNLGLNDQTVEGLAALSGDRDSC